MSMNHGLLRLRSVNVPVVAEAQKPDSKLVLLNTPRMPLWLSKPLHSLPSDYPLLNVIPLSLGLVTHAVWVISIAMAFKQKFQKGVPYEQDKNRER